MQRDQSPVIALALCLAALAGFVDALAYSGLGGFFASFMSGNTTRLGVAFAAARYDEVRIAGALILSFVAGVMVATVIARRWPARQQVAVMSAVTIALALTAVLTHFRPGMPALLLLAVAMGLENGSFTRGSFTPGGEVSIGLTHMTGALVRMAQRLAGALMGDADRWAWIPPLMLWLAFLCGVVAGAGCHAAFGTGALGLAAGGAGLLTIALAAIVRRPEPGPWGSRSTG